MGVLLKACSVCLPFLINCSRCLLVLYRLSNRTPHFSFIIIAGSIANWHPAASSASDFFFFLSRIQLRALCAFELVFLCKATRSARSCKLVYSMSDIEIHETQNWYQKISSDHLRADQRSSGLNHYWVTHWYKSQ